MDDGFKERKRRKSAFAGRIRISSLIAIIVVIAVVFIYLSQIGKVSGTPREFPLNLTFFSIFILIGVSYVSDYFMARFHMVEAIQRDLNVTNEDLEREVANLGKGLDDANKKIEKLKY